MGPQRMYGLTVWVRRLLVANLLVFLIQSTLLTSPSFADAFGFAPAHAWERPWTFVTYMFLHAGILHLALNLLVLWVFGSSVEERMGGRTFVLFYLLCGIGGAASSFLLRQLVPVPPMIGASGAIFGVAVAFAWYWPDHPVSLFPLPDPIPAKWLVTFLVGLDLVLALLKVSDGIAHNWRATRGERRTRQPAESSVLVSQPPRVSHSGAIPPSTRAPKPRSGSDARANAEIDRVLDKIIASGVESLTPAERKFLTEISRRLRTPPKP